MKTRILEKLHEVEKDKGIEILFAVESGSRAWGFASPDSDYDIRFVYRQSKNDYLNLWESSDTIQFMTEDDLDGSGWDLRKALRLLAKSNASFLGWLFSPIVYIDKEDALAELKSIAAQNFNPVAGFYHYHSMNKGFDELLGSDEMTLKNFFYAIRTALCAKWIREKEAIPPVLFKELYTLVNAEDQAKLDQLIDLKSERDEKGKEYVDPRLIALAKEVVAENNRLKAEVNNRKANLETFNALFLRLLK